MVSFSRHLRRHAHRLAKAPRSTWRRVYRYHLERPAGHALTGVYTPTSADAPLGEQDAKFWDWVLIGIITVVITALVVWGATAVA